MSKSANIKRNKNMLKLALITAITNQKATYSFNIVPSYRRSRRLLGANRPTKEFGFEAKVDFREGLRKLLRCIKLIKN